MKKYTRIYSLRVNPAVRHLVLGFCLRHPGDQFFKEDTLRYFGTDFAEMSVEKPAEPVTVDGKTARAVILHCVQRLIPGEVEHLRYVFERGSLDFMGELL